MRKLQILDTDSLCRSLKAEIPRSAEACFVHRLHCLLLMGEGYSSIEIAHLVGDDSSTVARWARHFNDFGMEGLREDCKTGRP